jgi:S1-C subfamily serine protease
VASSLADVVEPKPESPAVKAGILSDDVITNVNGQPVKDARDRAKPIGTMAPDSTIIWTGQHRSSFRNSFL